MNVGWIIAANVRGNDLEILNGIDLGTVNIDGDLGRIWVGDRFVTSAVKNLVVGSMGVLAAETAGEAGVGSVTSIVLGPIDNLHVLGDFAGFLNVLGSQFGTIGNLGIGGALLGGSKENSGRILFSGGIENGRIGSIVGGGGLNSGRLEGASNGTSHITSLRVGGLVSGGVGVGSSVIFAPLIQALAIGGLAGGTGANSGNVSALDLQTLVVKQSVTGGTGASSGEILATVSVGSVRVLGELHGGVGARSGLIAVAGGSGGISALGGIFGGSGAASGRIEVAGAMGGVRVGAIVGGSGANSGTITIATSVQELNVVGIAQTDHSILGIQGGSGAGSGGVDVHGGLAHGFIGGDIVGGDSAVGASLVKSGYLIAHRIFNLGVHGSLKSGTNNGTGLALSGTIRSETTIGSLNITGSVIGSAKTAAIIAAPGDATGAAIGSLTIGGSATFAEILAGYGADATVAKPRGSATNSDARIGTVKIVGTMMSSSIIAGVDAGTDGLFGTADDIPIGGAGTTNAARAVSRIASIIVGGDVLAGTVPAGIEAQYLNSIRVQGRPFSLLPGVGTDVAPGRELKTGSQIRVFEVPRV